MSDLTLLAVFAHPDDEAFGVGGALARYADEGVDVYLATATRGESGQIADPSIGSPANLPYIREQELRAACQTYGIHPPLFMDYVDGQLPAVHQGQAIGKLVRILREVRPQVIVTFGPEGIYGHYDHIAVHRWVTIGIDLAADPDCFPDQLAGACRPHRVDKLYYRVLSEEQVEGMAEREGQRASVDMDGVPFPFVGWPMEEITTIVDVSDYVDQKLRGILSHATQVGPEGPFEEPLEVVKQRTWFRQETYVLAHSTVGRPEGTETDLFAGLR